jgi:hypothetical protein
LQSTRLVRGSTENIEAMIDALAISDDEPRPQEGADRQQDVGCRDRHLERSRERQQRQVCRALEPFGGRVAVHRSAFSAASRTADGESVVKHR